MAEAAPRPHAGAGEEEGRAMDRGGAQVRILVHTTSGSVLRAIALLLKSCPRQEWGVDPTVVACGIVTRSRSGLLGPLTHCGKFRGLDEALRTSLGT